MKRCLIILLALFPVLAIAQDERAATLEARLKESVDSSPGAATIMLELLEIYEAEEQVFGVIRTASRFSRAQAEHPKRPDVIVKLLDGYAVTARHGDIITTARQFLAKYPSHPASVRARDHFATALEITGRVLPAAEVRAESWRKGGGDREAVRALALFQKSGSASALKQATALGLEMSEKMPAEPLLAAAALPALEMASKAELWAEGLKMVKNVQRRKAPLTAEQQRAYYNWAGQFESRLGQHANAIQSFRQAMGQGRDDVHRNLIYAVIAAK